MGWRDRARKVETPAVADAAPATAAPVADWRSRAVVVDPAATAPRDDASGNASTAKVLLRAALPSAIAGKVADSGLADTGQAALHNFSEGFGKQWTDEAIGRLAQGAYALADKFGVAPQTVTAPVDPHSLSGQITPGAVTTRKVHDSGDVYNASVATTRKELADESDKHPVASFLGNVGGEMASDYVLSKLGIPVASAPYAIAAGALSGAGAADENTPGGRLGGAGIGAGAGAIGSAAGHYVIGPLISKAGPVLTRALGRGLENLGIAQGKRALLNGADQLSRKITSDDAVREALRFGANGEVPAILPFGTAKGALKRLTDRVESLGTVYNDIVSRLEGAGVKGADARKLADDLMEKGSKDFVNSGADKSVADKYMSEAVNIEQLAQDGKLGLKQGENIKRTLQKEAKYDVAGPESRMNVARRDVASTVRQANEDAVEAAGKAAPAGSEVADMAESFVPVKQRLSRTLGAQEAAEKGAQRGGTRSWGGLALKLAKNPTEAATALATGGGVMNRLASTGASTAYAAGAALNGLSPVLGKIPAELLTDLGGILGRNPVIDRQIIAKLLRTRQHEAQPADQ